MTQIDRFSKPIILVAVWLLLFGVTFWSELHSMVVVWLNSNTYTHCMLVPFAVIYMFWNRRFEIFSVEAKPLPVSVVLSVPVLILWALGFAGEVQLFMHVAIISLIPLAYIALFGISAAWKARFPLAFLLFSVPIGDQLIPLFQEITADISSLLLSIFGIPYFRDALYISLPNGRFEVAEACSGIRFFIAMVAFGFLYAHINYRSVGRKVLFIVLSVVLPIIANGFRAFGIMVIGNYSNMQHAVGADHLIYGWGFFAFVMALLILVGNLFSEKAEQSEKNTESSVYDSWRLIASWKIASIALLPLLLALVWKPVIASGKAVYSVEAPSYSDFKVNMSNPQLNSWGPSFDDSDWELQGSIDGLRGVSIYQAYYSGIAKGHELISSKNRFYNIDSWALSSQTKKSLQIDGLNVEFRVLNVSTSVGPSRLIYYVYILPNSTHSDGRLAKLQQALTVMMGGEAYGKVLMYSAVFKPGGKQAVEELIESTIQSSFTKFNSSE